jgi:hypothetical protein
MLEPWQCRKITLSKKVKIFSRLTGEVKHRGDVEYLFCHFKISVLTSELKDAEKMDLFQTFIFYFGLNAEWQPFTFPVRHIFFAAFLVAYM